MCRGVSALPRSWLGSGAQCNPARVRAAGRRCALLLASPPQARAERLARTTPAAAARTQAMAATCEIAVVGGGNAAGYFAKAAAEAGLGGVTIVGEEPVGVSLICVQQSHYIACAWRCTRSAGCPAGGHVAAACRCLHRPAAAGRQHHVHTGAKQQPAPHTGCFL